MSAFEWIMAGLLLCVVFTNTMLYRSEKQYVAEAKLAREANQRTTALLNEFLNGGPPKMARSDALAAVEAEQKFDRLLQAQTAEWQYEHQEELDATIDTDEVVGKVEVSTVETRTGWPGVMRRIPEGVTEDEFLGKPEGTVAALREHYDNTDTSESIEQATLELPGGPEAREPFVPEKPADEVPGEYPFMYREHGDVVHQVGCTRGPTGHFSAVKHPWAFDGRELAEWLDFADNKHMRACTVCKPLGYGMKEPHQQEGQ